MSSIQKRKKFLQLWRLVTGPAINVMQTYFEVKILNNTKFENFLNVPHNIHQLFHQCYPTTWCCQCSSSASALPENKGTLSLQQFEKLYINSGIPQPDHEYITEFEQQCCLCKYSAKSTVTVDELDITLFYNVVQQCCPSEMNYTRRKKIKDVRNFLAHDANGQVEKAVFEDNWKTLNDATLAFAAEISNRFKKMIQEDILEIKESSIDAMTEKLEKSNEDIIKIKDTLNGMKQITVDERNKTVELINSKQDEHFSKLESSFGNICKSDEILKEARENKTEMHKLTSEIQEIKQKINPMTTITVDKLAAIISIAVEKILEKTKGTTLKDDKRTITVETQVDSTSLDEENTIRNILNTIITKIDKKSCDTEKFHIKNVEQKCIQLELVAFPDVFKTPHNLRKALKSLVHRLVEAGEVDTKIPGNLKINLTVKTPLTREEMAVVFAVFNTSETSEESAVEGIDVKPNLYDGNQALKIDPDSLNKSYLKSEQANIDDSTVTQNVKIELTDEEKYEEIFVDVDNIRCLLRLTGLPNDLYPSEHEEKSFTVKGNKLFYVEWTMECPLKWNVALIVSSINGNLSSFHDEFPVDYVYSETNSKLMMHTTAQRCVFRSYSSLEVAVKNFIGKIKNVSSIKSPEPEELSASVLIMTKPDEEEFPEDEFNTQVKTDQTIFGLKDDIVTCNHCTKDFSCKKCLSKISHIRRLNQALNMKDQTIQRLERALTKREEDMSEGDESDHKSYFSEEPDEDTTKIQTTAEIDMTGEPEHKKRKTAITSDIEKSKDNQTEDAGKSLNHIKVDMKQALLKLGEIPLLDYYIDIYKTYLKNLRAKWGRRDIKPKNEHAIKDRLVMEKKKRTALIAKLKDVIHNQDVFKTTDESYSTDRRFLDVDENPAIKCNYCHTKEENQISCYCLDCQIFICDNCVIEHRMKNKKHYYRYQPKILRGYKLANTWNLSSYSRITDWKFMTADIVAILLIDKLCTCNLTGKLINTFPIRVDQEKSRIACINDCKIAVTVPSNNLIKIFTILASTTLTDLITPEETNMTGGITCRMDILYVAFSDAIRLMDLSGQIQRVVNIPGVKLLHSVNNDKMLCVYKKFDSDKTMSCLDCTNDSLYHFESFLFHPEDVTTDDVDNIIFMEDGVIWQADSDGKNIKLIMTPEDSYNSYTKITYNKDSKCLFTKANAFHSVKVYRKLDTM